MFDDALHVMTLSEDGSYTAYSKEYDEHYHSTKDGALHESNVKHVHPAFKLKEKLEEVTILDICYGLGFNTLATIRYHRQNDLTCKLNIYSPELDAALVRSLKEFHYPDEFEGLEDIIFALSQKGVYDDELLHVELFLGDAREYIKTFEEEKFDIVYQDAFSPQVNPILWTKEYFSDIAKIIKKDGILTTYSTALKTRLALYENGFYIYINEGKNYRNATVASKSELPFFRAVDMKHKIECNPDVKSLKDEMLF